MIKVYRTHNRGGSIQLYLTVPGDTHNDAGMRSFIFQMIAGAELDIELTQWTLQTLVRNKEFSPFAIQINKDSIVVGNWTYTWEKINDPS